MSRHHNLYAALLALTASAILSLIDNFVSKVAEEAGLWQFQVFRTLFALPVLLIWARVVGIAWRPVVWRRVLLRSLAVGSGLLIYFGSLGMLPVAQAGAGLFSSPLWLLVFSAVLFKTRVSLWQWLAMALGFVGVLLLLQPDMSRLSVTSFVPLVAGAFYGLGMLLTRHQCADETAITLVIGVFVTIGLASLIMLLGFTLWPVAAGETGFMSQGWVTPTPLFLLLTLGQALGAVVAVSLITQAYRVGEPSLVAVVEYSFLISAAVWAWLLWGRATSLIGLLGIAIILVSGATMYRLSKERES